MGISIRQWRLSDAKDLAAALSNQKVLNNLRDGLPYPYTDQDAQDYIRAVLSADPDQTFAYAVCVDDKVFGQHRCIPAGKYSSAHGGAGLLPGRSLLGTGDHDPSGGYALCPAVFRNGSSADLR